MGMEILKVIRKLKYCYNTWMLDVRTEMGEKGIEGMEWIDRGEWRIKIKLKL